MAEVIMHRTTIMLPPELKRQANAKAETLGISLSELIRRCLESEVTVQSWERLPDPLLDDDARFEGPTPSDLARRHDDYLYR
jgi:hypothetical protein